MHKLIYIFSLFAAVSAVLGLCGCGGNHNEISVEELTGYLEKKYNDEFTLKDSEEFSPYGRGTDTLYTFESGSGISCHISKVYGGGFIGYSYSYTEDYPVIYLREHPELIAELFEGAFEVERIDRDDHYCFESKYILYFDGYEEIETILEFIDDFLEGTKAIPDSDYVVSDRKIIQRRPDITVGIRESNYRFGVYYYYPTENHSDTGSKEDFLESMQNTYVKLVREGKLSETLSEELLNKCPASEIRNITFNGERVISCMVYRGQNGEYSIDQSCIEYKGCKFYPDKLGGLLRSLGWSEKISRRSVIWSNGTDEIELCLKGYGINNTELHCFKNSEEYQVCGRLLWQSGTNPIVTLSESDLKYLFGMVFEFDQINLTGRLISG